jgi:peptidoglycan hydrolase-like protein with peptidoglycan-binding domain
MAAFLKQGSQGPDVRRLQEALNAIKLPPIPGLANQPLQVDGIFGPKTRGRVIQFQKTAGLDADGIVGPKTANALLAISIAQVSGLKV